MPLRDPALGDPVGVARIVEGDLVLDARPAHPVAFLRQPQHAHRQDDRVIVAVGDVLRDGLGRQRYQLGRACFRELFGLQPFFDQLALE